MGCLGERQAALLHYLQVLKKELSGDLLDFEDTADGGVNVMVADLSTFKEVYIRFSDYVVAISCQTTDGSILSVSVLSDAAEQLAAITVAR